MIKVGSTTFVLIISLALLAPFAYLWALNTLFPALELEYSFVNWLAVCLLHAFFHTKVGLNK